MEGVRQFKIVNNLGQEFDLLRKDAIFISPSGLGFQKTKNTARAGDFYLDTEIFNDEGLITGTIAFKGYAPYSEFISFIKYEPLLLMYKPESTWYKRDIEITRLTKGEIDNTGIRLYSDIDMSCSAGWYTVKTATAEIIDVETETPKVYPYEYPYEYHGSVSGTATIETSNDGTPCRVTFLGPVTNPEYVVYNAGERVGAGRFNCTVGEGEALVVDSTPTNIQASIIDRATGEILRNAYGYGDLSTERFVYLPKGNNTFAIGCYGTTEGFTAIIEVRDYATTV